MTARRRVRAAQHGLDGADAARMLEVGRVQVEPQQLAAEQRAPARTSAGRRPARPTRVEVPRVSAGAASVAPARRGAAGRGPPTSRRSRPASRAARPCRRRRARRSRAAAIPASLSSRRPATTARRVSSPSRPTNSAARGPRARSGAAGASAWRCWKPCWAIASPPRARSASHCAISGARSWNGMQVGRRDDEQRHAVDAVVVQPVADQRAALERRRLDVVQRDREQPAAPAHRSGRHVAVQVGPARMRGHGLRFPCSPATFCEEPAKML